MTHRAALRQIIARLGMTECEAMDRLQDRGIVSDCAVHLADCAESDLQEACHRMDWRDLETTKEPKPTTTQP